MEFNNKQKYRQNIKWICILLIFLLFGVLFAAFYFFKEKDVTTIPPTPIVDPIKVTPPSQEYNVEEDNLADTFNKNNESCQQNTTKIIIAPQKQVESVAETTVEQHTEPSTEKPFPPSSGGGFSYIPAPEFHFILPENSYVGDDVKITPTSKYVSTVTWSVTKGTLPVELSRAFEGKLSNDGGTLKAKEVGKYNIIATAKNSLGKEVTHSQTVTVYPVVTVNFTLPKTAHTDTSIAMDLKTENLGKNAVVWAVTKNGKKVELDTAITGKLENTGGTIQLKEQGNYTLTATITDEIGKVVTVSHKITVYPVAEVKLNSPAATHTDKTITIKAYIKNNEDLQVSWSLTKDGKEVEIAKYIKGNLALSDSSIRFTEKGVYQLTITLADKTGRKFTDTAKVTVYPVGSVGFYLPTILHTDDTVKVETTLAEIGDKTALWTITKDGKKTALSYCISGTLANNGGNIRFKDKGEYILNCSFTDEGGRNYSYEQKVKVYPVPTVTYTQPKFVHTDTALNIKTTVSNLEGLTLEWLVDNSFGYQDFATFVDGALNNNGGNIHFKRAGIYELVCRTTDKTDRVFLFKPKNKTEVLPVLTLGFELPKVAYTDTPIDIRTSGHNNTLPMEWTITKDEKAVSLAQVLDGTLNGLGGKVNFKSHGEYVLTAIMTDILGRSYSHSESITVMPIVNFAFTMSKEVRYGDEIKVDISKSEHIDKANVVWTLTKNGEAVSYTGKLDKSGGTITIRDTGNFMLAAVVTDSLGRECRYTQEITVINTPPTITSFTATPTRTVKDGKFFVELSATATDAENHETVLEWQGTSEYGYYAVGTYTVKVRAKDTAGAYSDWISKTFTVNNSAPTRPVITRTPNGNSVVPGTPVTITAESTDADGDAITYVWEGRPNETTTYPLGKNTVRVKAVDSTGAESPWAAIVFFVMDNNGSGGMLLTGPDSNILENGIEGATITKYTFTVPPVSGHSGNDYGRVRGYNVLTKQWDQLDYGTTINGITFTKSLSGGLYSKLEFYYYTNHNCMYQKSNITYTVDYFFE